MTERDEVQAKIRAVIDKPGDPKRYGIIAATGAGKSKIACEYVSDEIAKGKKVLWITSSIQTRDFTVKEEFDRWKLKGYDKMQRLCYAYIHKVKGEEYDLVVMDEGDEITELRYEFFEQNKVKDILFLTATPPEDELKQFLISKLKIKVVVNISFEQAINLGLINDVTIVALYVDLDTAKTLEVTRKGKPTFKTNEVYRNTYLERNIQQAYFSRNSNYINAARGLRNNFLYTLGSKRKAAKRLLAYLNKKYPKDKKIVFTQRKSQAESICKHAYHSSTTNESYDLFCKGNILNLGVVNKVNRAENIPKLRIAIVEQLYSSSKDLVQRIGRAVRKQGNQSYIIILVAKGTQDEEWFKKATKNFTRIHKLIYDGKPSILDNYLKE